MENSKELRFKCLQCGNCCIDKNTLVNVTYIDIIRMKNGLELSIDEVIEILGFYIFEKEPTIEELEKMVVPPIETERGLAFIGLKKKRETEYLCYFYDPENKRCKIYDLRPNFCRTFPFTFRLFINKEDPTKGKIKMSYTDKAVEFCPGINKDAPLINDLEWIKMGKETLENMNADQILVENWNLAVKEEQIFPSVRNYLYTILSL